jgi:hypothetical protein
LQFAQSCRLAQVLAVSARFDPALEKEHLRPVLCYPKAHSELNHLSTYPSTANSLYASKRINAAHTTTKTYVTGCYVMVVAATLLFSPLRPWPPQTRRRCCADPTCITTILLAAAAAAAVQRFWWNQCLLLQHWPCSCYTIAGRCGL